jgi:predicted ABC-type ATPase
VDEDQSLQYAKDHRREFVNQVVNNISIDDNKVAMFMAGSPGSGKTEVATSLTELYANLAVIDADAFRSQFPGYNGTNSSEFQHGASWLVDHVFTYLLHHDYSFLLDGTFAIGRAAQNIDRALKHGYEVTIYYVYQDPYVAWDFTQVREKNEGRFVPKERFINAYFKSRDNVVAVKQQFGDKVELNIVFKDYQNQIKDVVTDVDNVELVLPARYTKEKLEAELHD